MRVVDGRVEQLRGEPPLSLKAVRRAGSLDLAIVGSAASLLENDHLDISIDVIGTVPVVVRSAAAQLAHPCLDGGSTAQQVSLTVGPRASLWWAVEPLIVSAYADHEASINVSIAAGGWAVIQDLVVLGRSGEDARAAVLRSEMTAMLNGEPLFEDGLHTALPGAHGPAGLAGRRSLGTVAALGWRPVAALGRQPDTASGADAGTMALAGPGTIRRAMAVDAAPVVTLISTTGHDWWSQLLAEHSDEPARVAGA